MVVNETLPLCPDLVLDAENTEMFSEPVEVGPFEQGIVFVKLFDVEGDPSIDAAVGISPSGYEEWDTRWTVIDSLDGLEEEGVYAVRLSNFGNWIRVKFTLGADVSPDDSGTVLAWFAGDG